MTELVGQTCEACRKGAPPATGAEIAEYSRQIPEWEIVDRAGIPALERVFAFPNFVAAMEFTNRVGELAEDKIRNLHVNDFVMAAKTDRVAGET